MSVHILSMIAVMADVISMQCVSGAPMDVAQKRKQLDVFGDFG